jgi:hypothetical protein
VSPFHATIHARPTEAKPAGAVTIAGVEWPALHVPQAALAAPFAITFEEAADRLAQLPRMHVEADGSFVWVSATADGSWQIDGVLYDRGGRLLFADLKGNLSPHGLDELLAALGWPQTPVIFQLVREAVFLDEATFRSYATTRNRV